LFFFFFSSRRRHTRCSRDWSSDVCSSDLMPFQSPSCLASRSLNIWRQNGQRSEERRVGKSVDLGGRRIIKKKKQKKQNGKETEGAHHIKLDNSGDTRVEL